MLYYEEWIEGARAPEDAIGHKATIPSVIEPSFDGKVFYRRWYEVIISFIEKYPAFQPLLMFSGSTLVKHYWISRSTKMHEETLFLQREKLASFLEESNPNIAEKILQAGHDVLIPIAQKLIDNPRVEVRETARRIIKTESSLSRYRLKRKALSLLQFYSVFWAVILMVRDSRQQMGRHELAGRWW